MNKSYISYVFSRKGNFKLVSEMTRRIACLALKCQPLSRILHISGMVQKRFRTDLSIGYFLKELRGLSLRWFY